jgi:hypothetical protein
LLWQTLDPTSRRITTFSPRSGLESFHRCLPSWSWIDWTGLVCAGPKPLFLVILPEIRIYIYDQRNGFRPIEDTYAIPNSESLWFGNRKILISTGLPDESAHFPSPPDHVDMLAPTGTNSTEAATAVPAGDGKSLLSILPHHILLRLFLHRRHHPDDFATKPQYYLRLRRPQLPNFLDHGSGGHRPPHTHAGIALWHA